MRVYSGALTQVKDQTVEVTKTLPVPGSTQVVVQTEVRGKGEPIKLDYRLDKAGDGLEDHRRQRRRHVAGAELPLAVRQEISKGGIDGLITTLVERNKARGQELSDAAPCSCPPRHARRRPPHWPRTLPRRAWPRGSGPLRIDASALHDLRHLGHRAAAAGAARWRRRPGARFEVTGAPPKLAELARLYGVEELLSLAPSPRPRRRSAAGAGSS